MWRRWRRAGCMRPSATCRCQVSFARQAGADGDGTGDRVCRVSHVWAGVHARRACGCPCTQCTQATVATVATRTLNMQQAPHLLIFRDCEFDCGRGRMIMGFDDAHHAHQVT